MLVTVCMERNKKVLIKAHMQTCMWAFEIYDKRLIPFLEKSMYTEHWLFFSMIVTSLLKFDEIVNILCALSL